MSPTTDGESQKAGNDATTTNRVTKEAGTSDPSNSNKNGSSTTKATTAAAAASATPAGADKVKVHFVAVGSAPIMRKSKFQISADQRFAAVTAFLRKILKLQDSSSAGSSLFLYVSSAFVPGPEEVVGDLRDCFGVRDELIIHYSLQEAWG